LAEAGHHDAAIDLLDRMLQDFPEGIELAQAHLQKAESLAALGHAEQAVQEFRGALQCERNLPNVRTHAWLTFGWFVIERQMDRLYEEVSCAMDEFHDVAGETFPALQYRYCVLRTVIAEAKGDNTTAAEFANKALTEAARGHSGFRYHPTLGLVGAEHDRFEQKLNALARLDPIRP
jgi:tetratricopeptide (TPR) repeat protein